MMLRCYEPVATGEGGRVMGRLSPSGCPNRQQELNRTNQVYRRNGPLNFLCLRRSRNVVFIPSLVVSGRVVSRLIKFAPVRTGLRRVAFEAYQGRQRGTLIRCPFSRGRDTMNFEARQGTHPDGAA